MKMKLLIIYLYMNYFEKHKDEILIYLTQFYEDDFIIPCLTSKIFLIDS